MTYDRIKLDDMQLLDVLYAARENRALVCVHAENHAMISWAAKRLLANGYRAPRCCRRANRPPLQWPVRDVTNATLLRTAAFSGWSRPSQSRVTTRGAKLTLAGTPHLLSLRRRRPLCERDCGRLPTGHGTA